MLDAGADFRPIEAVLGYVSLAITERHTNVTIGKLRQVHAETTRL